MDGCSRVRNGTSDFSAFFEDTEVLIAADRFSRGSNGASEFSEFSEFAEDPKGGLSPLIFCR